MDSSHQFNRKEISKILKRAAELEQQGSKEDDHEVLTLHELEQLSKEVGLQPEHIRRAAEELENPAPSFTSKLMGGPFSLQQSATINGRFTNEEWEEIIFEIRRISGGNGTLKKVGNIFEWEQRDNETGLMQIALNPKEKSTKININANYNDHAAVVYGAVGTIGIACMAILISILFKKAGIPLLPLLAVGGVGVVAFAGALRFYMSRWMDNKREKISTIFKRIQEILNPDGQQKTSGDRIRFDKARNEAPESEASTNRSRQKA